MMTQTTSLTFFMNCYALIETEYRHFKMIFINVNKLTVSNGQIDEKVLKSHLIDAINLHIDLKR